MAGRAGDSAILSGRYGVGSGNEESRITRDLVLQQKHAEQAAKDAEQRSKAPTTETPQQKQQSTVPIGAVSTAARSRYDLHNEGWPPVSRDLAEVRLAETRREATRGQLTHVPAVPLTEGQIIARNDDFRARVIQQLNHRRFVAQFGHTIDALSETRVCVRCRQYFSLIESIGSWQCRFHPGRPDRFTQKWSCCNRTYARVEALEIPTTVGAFGNACTPIDHIYLDRNVDGVSDGLGVWRIPADLRKAFKHEFWVEFKPGTDAVNRTSAVWNVRSPLDQAGDATVGIHDQQQAEENTVLEAHIRNREWAGRMEELGLVVNSRYVSLTSKSPEQLADERRLRERAAADIIVSSSPLFAGPAGFISTGLFELVRIGPAAAREVAPHLFK